MKKLTTKLRAALTWATSPEGRKDLGALAAIAMAIYTGLHSAGV